MYHHKTKWGNARKTVYSGNLYDSKFEAQYGFELDLRQKAKEIVRWERQKVIELKVNDKLVCTYKIDFVVYYPDNTIEYVETKGVASREWKIKWKLFEALYADLPKVKLTVVYQGERWNPRQRKIGNIVQ